MKNIIQKGLVMGVLAAVVLSVPVIAEAKTKW